MSPKGDRTRPTGDRVREALFNIWRSRVVGSRMLDGYAGTGAIGLEALSRGARQVVFSEVSRTARRVIEHNMALVALPGAEIWPGTVESLLEAFSAQGRQFDLVFCDPPWADGLSVKVQDEIHRVLSLDGMVVVESRQSDLPVPLAHLAVIWTRRYGDTRLTAYQVPS